MMSFCKRGLWCGVRALCPNREFRGVLLSGKLLVQRKYNTQLAGRQVCKIRAAPTLAPGRAEFTVPDSKLLLDRNVPFLFGTAPAALGTRCIKAAVVLRTRRLTEKVRLCLSHIAEVHTKLLSQWKLATALPTAEEDGTFCNQ